MFGFLLAVFIIGTYILFGKGQLLLIGLLLAGGYTLYFLKERKSLPGELVVYFLWCAWSLTGIAVCPDKEAFFDSLLVVFQIIIMSFAIIGITEKRGSIGLNYMALAIGGILLLGISFIGGEVQAGLSVASKVQVKGLTRNPNYYSYGLLLSVIALLYFWGLKPSWKARAVLGLLMGAMALGILVSASRKAFIGFLLLILLWLWMCYRKFVMQRLYLIIPMILILIGLGLFTDYMLENTYMGKRFRKDFVEDPIHERRTDHVRVSLYKEGLHIIMENPLFGVGLGNFAVLSKHRLYSHSDYIEVASSTGIIGFCIYFTVYLQLWRRLGRVKKRLHGYFIQYNIGLAKAAIITILVLALGRPNIYSNATWVFLSSLIGYFWHLERKIELFDRYQAHLRHQQRDLS